MVAVSLECVLLALKVWLAKTMEESQGSSLFNVQLEQPEKH